MAIVYPMLLTTQDGERAAIAYLLRKDAERRLPLWRRLLATLGVTVVVL